MYSAIRAGKRKETELEEIFHIHLKQKKASLLILWSKKWIGTTLRIKIFTSLCFWEWTRVAVSRHRSKAGAVLLRSKTHPKEVHCECNVKPYHIYINSCKNLLTRIHVIVYMMNSLLNVNITCRIAIHLHVHENFKTVHPTTYYMHVQVKMRLVHFTCDM